MADDRTDGICVGILAALAGGSAAVWVVEGVAKPCSVQKAVVPAVLFVPLRGHPASTFRLGCVAFLRLVFVALASKAKYLAAFVPKGLLVVVF